MDELINDECTTKLTFGCFSFLWRDTSLHVDERINSCSSTELAILSSVILMALTSHVLICSPWIKKDTQPILFQYSTYNCDTIDLKVWKSERTEPNRTCHTSANPPFPNRFSRTMGWFSRSKGKNLYGETCYRFKHRKSTHGWVWIFHHLWLPRQDIDEVFVLLMSKWSSFS